MIIDNEYPDQGLPDRLAAAKERILLHSASAIGRNLRSRKLIKVQ